MKWILLAALLAPQDTAREREIENKIASVPPRLPLPQIEEKLKLCRRE